MNGDRLIRAELPGISLGKLPILYWAKFLLQWKNVVQRLLHYIVRSFVYTLTRCTTASFFRSCQQYYYLGDLWRQYPLCLTFKRRRSCLRILLLTLVHQQAGRRRCSIHYFPPHGTRWAARSRVLRPEDRQARTGTYAGKVRAW